MTRGSGSSRFGAVHPWLGRHGTHRPSQPAWTSFHADLAASKFADVESFTPETIDRLERAWEYRTGDVSDGSGALPSTVWSATPVYANETLYLGTPFYRIVALDPATGAERWAYDSRSTLEALTQPSLKNRGVAFWESGSEGFCEKRVFIGTMDAELHAVDADAGTPCEDFGEGGVLDVNQWNTVNDKFPFSLLQPPAVVGDTLLLGWAGKDWEYSVAPPGNLLAVDARTGELLWDTSFVPQEMIPRTAHRTTSGPAMSADSRARPSSTPPVSSPSPNYWGGDPNRSDAARHVRERHRHRDGRDRVELPARPPRHLGLTTPPSAPTLVDIERDGQTIPALVQATKQGFLFVLDRRTGEPLFPSRSARCPRATRRARSPRRRSPSQPSPLP